MADETTVKLTITRRVTPSNQSQWAVKLITFEENITQAEGESDSDFLERVGIALEIQRHKLKEQHGHDAG